MPRRRSHSAATRPGVSVSTPVGIGQDHEVVAGAVALHEPHTVNHDRTTRSADATRSGRRPVEPHDPGVAAEPRPLPAHEPPGRAHRLVAGLRPRSAAPRPDRRAPAGSPAPGEAVRPSRSPRDTSAAISATSPSAHIRSTRVAIRSSSTAGSRSTPSCTASDSTGVGAGSVAANGCPVSSITSSARTIRRPLLGRIRAAAPGSAAAQPLVQRRRTDRGQLRLQPGPQRGVGAGKRRTPPARPARRDRSRRPAAVPGRGRATSSTAARASRLVRRHARRLGHVPDVQYVVRHALPLGRRQLGRADVHAPVELHRVGVDHLAAERVGQRQ